MWYAHTRKGLGKDQWELLRNHLAAVAEAARQHGCRFGGGELASLAGQIHDLGKYSLDFQKRLEGLSHRVDHSTAGAAWAQERLPGRWGRMLAHVVAGHHAGLQDDLLAFDGRLAAKRSAMLPAEQAARADGIVLPGSVAGPRLLGQNAGFIQAFLTRMVFSCLLDADRSETARFVVKSHPNPTPFSLSIVTPLAGADVALCWAVCDWDGAVGKWPAGATVESLA